MRTRQPNEGPYIVSYRLTLVDGTHGNWIEQECHTWKYACERMKQLLNGGHDVKVKFA